MNPNRSHESAGRWQVCRVSWSNHSSEAWPPGPSAVLSDPSSFTPHTDTEFDKIKRCRFLASLFFLVPSSLCPYYLLLRKILSPFETYCWFSKIWLHSPCLLGSLPHSPPFQIGLSAFATRSHTIHTISKLPSLKVAAVSCQGWSWYSERVPDVWGMTLRVTLRFCLELVGKKWFNQQGELPLQGMSHNCAILDLTSIFLRQMWNLGVKDGK